MMSRVGKFDLRININKVQSNLKIYLRKNMYEVMTKLVAYIVDNFGPSNNMGAGPFSSPGSPPNTGTGKLRQSITFTVKAAGSEIVGEYGVMTGPATAYARRLELGFVGTDSRGRVYQQQPRPFLKPAYSLNRKKIKQILAG